jgi:hypothetical protein
MNSITNLIGIVLILAGLFMLGYQGFTYTKHEQVAQIGALQITADKEKSVYFPPALGGAALVAGIVLVVVARRK